MDKIELFVVDDHQLIREGIMKMFNEVSDIKIVGTAADGEEALKKILDLEPDVVLIDISMPGLFGDQVIRMVKNERDDIKFLVMTVYDSDLYIYKTFSAGGEGFIPKDAGKEEIISAVRKIAEGGRYFRKYNSDEKLAAFLDSFEARNHSRLDYDTTLLTLREKEIAKKIKEGKENSVIAAELFISIKTVQTHLANICRKLDVTNNRELYALIISDEKLKRLLGE